jgi:hypothetical protein
LNRLPSRYYYHYCVFPILFKIPTILSVASIAAAVALIVAPAASIAAPVTTIAVLATTIVASEAHIVLTLLPLHQLFQ